jgi:hypothetical protein
MLIVYTKLFTRSCQKHTFQCSSIDFLFTTTQSQSVSKSHAYSLMPGVRNRGLPVKED